MNADALKVFLVEDNADTRFLLAYLLRDLGHDVREAASVGEALEGFARSPSDVLISDVGLPDGSGQELPRRLRAIGRSPYAIAVSGFGALSDMEASLAAGFRHHLVKPIDLDVLARLLAQAREERDAQRPAPSGQTDGSRPPRR